ncbi:McrC family protein [Helicobacter sp. MIT 99-5507]|uniref:McrC family protein n=1 Tax=Helicobacter sp. MIT 99-5507 TaxID=152489 RepID=UPI0011C0605D|nr:McrC family protein [Helicobacter sp. MIT 99-5507]
MNHKTLCIAEWQSFGVEEIQQVLGQKDNQINEKLENQARKIFEELVEFAHTEGNHIYLKFAGKKLKAQNYVGLIQTKSGFYLEILPKTFRTAKESEGFVSKDIDNKQNSIKSAKTLLLKMLQSLKDSPFKQSHFAHLKLAKMPLLEIFILMFLEELEKLVKKGLKSDYIVREQNRKFLKGKLLFNENLKLNFAHKEKFFTSSDEFSANIAPNRIIKSTLVFLSTQNLSAKTSTKLTQARFIFADISPSQHIAKDFSQCRKSRYLKGYYPLLQWCEIFLRCKTFTSYQGNSQAFALLFDMNKLFESFVASEMKKWLCGMKLSYENEAFMEQIFEENKKDSYLKTQEKSKYLVVEGDKKRFLLNPDIVGYQKQQIQAKQPLFIADTKWKILSQEKQNYGISQSDMYQIFAYLAKYQCKRGFLIYPKIKDCKDTLENLELIFKPEIFNKDNQEANKVKLTLCFFNV